MQTRKKPGRQEEQKRGKRLQKSSSVTELIHLTAGNYWNECDEEGFASEDVMMYPEKDVIQKALLRALEEGLPQLQYVSHQNICSFIWGITQSSKGNS